MSYLSSAAGDVVVIHCSSDASPDVAERTLCHAALVKNCDTDGRRWCGTSYGASVICERRIALFHPHES